MPIYWVAQGVQKASTLTPQAEANIIAGLAFLGWVIAGAAAWFFGDEPLFPPGVGAGGPWEQCYANPEFELRP